MKFNLVVIVILLYSININSEVLTFHVTTIDGDNLSGVGIKIMETQTIEKITTNSGLCTFWSKTDKFQDISALVQKKGWVVIQTDLGTCVKIDYREKTKVIEIKMRQIDEIYSNQKGKIQTEILPVNYSLVNQKIKPIQIITPKKISIFQVQIKCSVSPISENIINGWKGNSSLTITQFLKENELYAYKYRVTINVNSIDEAYSELQKIKNLGFSDSFLVVNSQ